jgi:hypothetical protein
MLLDLAARVAEPLRDRVLVKAIDEARYPVNWHEGGSDVAPDWEREARQLLAQVVDRALQQNAPRLALIAACAIYDGFRQVVAELEEDILAPTDDDQEWVESQLAEALVDRAEALPMPLLPAALAAVGAMRDDENRARALAGLAPYLPETLCQQGFAIAQGLADPDARRQVLARLAPAGDAQPARQSPTQVSTSDDQRLADELVRLAPRLPVRRRAQVLAAAREIEDPRFRVQTIVRLAPHLPAGLRVEALADALAAAYAVQSEHGRVEALRELAPHLPEPLLAEALAAARATQPPYLRAVMLQALTTYLPEPLAAQALAEAVGEPPPLTIQDDYR